MVQEQVKSILQVTVDGGQEKYLGLPTPAGRMHKGRFSNLQEQLMKRIVSWDYPSQGGKEILIKAIAQSVPTYLMGVFKLPMAVCDDLTRMVRNFWWGSRDGKRKTHWKSWDVITRPKLKVGLVSVTSGFSIKLYWHGKHGD
jgi:hypothetical protein